MDIMKLLNDDENFGKFCVELIEKDYDEKTKERLKEIRKRGPKNYNLPKADVNFVEEGEVDFLLDAEDEAKIRFRELKDAGLVDEGEVDFLLDAMDEAKNKFREQKEDA